MTCAPYFNRLAPQHLKIPKQSKYSNFTSLNHFGKSTNMRDLLAVLSSCWRCFEMDCPYTSARLQHWLYFLSDANRNTLDHYSLMPPILPLYLYLLTGLIELHFDMTGFPDRTPPALRFVSDALDHLLLINRVMDRFSALLVVITTPGFAAKFFVGKDLCIDLYLTQIAKETCCILFLTPIVTGACVVYGWWFAGALAEARLE